MNMLIIIIRSIDSLARPKYRGDQFIQIFAFFDMSSKDSINDALQKARESLKQAESKLEKATRENEICLLGIGKKL